MTMNQNDLMRYMTAYPAVLPRTLSLEQKIRIGTGFHGKWYTSQRQHMLGWLVFQDCKARMAGLDPESLKASTIWNRLKCSPSMYWLAESAGVSSDLLDQAEEAAIRATVINPRDGNPHGTYMRKIIPWPILEEAIRNGPSASPEDYARIQANAAFDRLAEKRSACRKYIPFKV